MRIDRFALGMAVLLLPTTLQAATLTRTQENLLTTQLIPAYQAGDAAALFESIERLTSRLSPEKVASLDEFLEQRKLPKLGRMSLEARMSNVRAGGKFLAPKPKPTEVTLIATAHLDQLSEVSAAVQPLKALAAAKLEAKTLTDYEPLFWSLEQAERQIWSVGTLSPHVNRMLSAVQRPESEPNELTQSLNDAVDKLHQLYTRARERQLELRVQRLKDAVSLLASSENVKDRLIAAHVVDMDGAVLLAAIKPAQAGAAPYASAALNGPQLRTEIEQQVDEGSQLAGDLMDKSRKLYAGIYWWLRGRYGRGVKFYGLIKADTARISQVGENQLYMPAELPKNDQVASSTDYDYPDRRHYYDWMWEERTLMIRRSDGAPQPIGRSKSSSRKPVPQTVKTTPRRTGKISFQGRRGVSRFGGGFSGGGTNNAMFLSPSATAYDRLGWSVDDLYKRLGYDPPKAKQTPYKKPQPTQYRRVYIESYIPPQDPYIIRQLVGFTEYGKALSYLDDLVKSCNDEERKAIDELIAERDELVVETNLSRTVEQPSALSEQPEGAGDTFKRRGLIWVTALARVELAAMLAGFSDREDAFFRLAAQYDMTAYRELIEDGMRTHYWSLTKDQDLKPILAGDADANRTLAYFRRLLVAEALLKAAAQMGAQDYTPAQRAQITTWRANLEKTQKLIAQRIADLHQTRVEVQVK